MPRRSTRSSPARVFVPTIAATLLLAACRNDTVTTFDAGCVNEPGCTSAAVLEPTVLDALDDADTRSLASLTPDARLRLHRPLVRLQEVLRQRDLPAGRRALSLLYDAIEAEERRAPESLAELGAIRLSLLPAARALGMPLRELSIVVTP